MNRAAQPWRRTGRPPARGATGARDTERPPARGATGARGTERPPARGATGARDTGRPSTRGATGARDTGRPAVRFSRAGVACLFLVALTAACDRPSDEPLAESRPPYARFELVDRTAAGYALDSLLRPPLLAPAGARCRGVFTIEEIDADSVILRLSETVDGDGHPRPAVPGDGASGDARRAVPRQVAAHLLDLLDPLDPHPEAFRLYFIEGAADYARGHAPAHRVGIEADNERLYLRRADARDVTLTARPGEIATRLTHPAFSPPPESAESERARAEFRRRGAAVVSVECAGEVDVEIAVRGTGAGGGGEAVNRGGGETVNPAAGETAAPGPGETAPSGPKPSGAEQPVESFPDSGYGDPAVESTVRAPGTTYDILVANTSAGADGMPAESGYSGERYGGSAAPIEAGSTITGDSTAPGDSRAAEDSTAAEGSTGEASPQLAPLAELELRREVMRIARAALDRSPPAERFAPVTHLGNTTSVAAAAGRRLAAPAQREPAASVEAAGNRSIPLRLIAAPPLVSALEPLADALAAHDLELSRAPRGSAREYTGALFRGDFDLALIRWESESGAPGEILRLFRPYDPRNFTGSGAPESFEVLARERHEVGFALYLDDGDDVDSRAAAVERFGSPRVSPYGVPYF